MNTSAQLRPTPEECELRNKQHELANLETDLAQRELDMATLHAELHALERQYIKVVGVLYARLDEVEANIAQYHAELNPGSLDVQRRAEETRAQAEDSAQAVSQLAASREEAKDFRPSERLKKLYREVAKRIHPDLATDEEERARREILMVEVNQVYENGDEEQLLNILRQWEVSPESIKGEGVAIELVRTIRKIAQIKDRILVIDEQMQLLKNSDLHQLKMKIVDTEAVGRDLFAELVDRLDEQIQDAKKRLNKVLLQRSD